MPSVKTPGFKVALSILLAAEYAIASQRRGLVLLISGVKPITLVHNPSDFDVVVVALAAAREVCR